MLTRKDLKDLKVKLLSLSQDIRDAKHRDGKILSRVMVAGVKINITEKMLEWAMEMSYKDLNEKFSLEI